MSSLSPAYGAKLLLIGAGVAVEAPTADQWAIKVSRLPATPHKIIATFDTQGSDPNPKWLVDYATIAVRIRGDKDKYEETYDKAKEVKDALLGLTSQQVGDLWWVSVTGLGDLIFLGYDDIDRPSFSINFRIIIEPPTNALTNRESL